MILDNTNNKVKNFVHIILITLCTLYLFACSQKVPTEIDLANSLLKKGDLYIDQSRYEEAEPLYRRSLVIREKVFGPEHPAVAQSLNNLASLYDTQGRYSEAEPLYKRSLVIRGP